MPSDDRHADAADPARSLSEQLRDLESQLGRIDDIALPRPGQRNRLPTFLGRPIGLTQPDGFPLIGELTAGPDARTLAEVAPRRRSALSRGAAITGVMILLLGATAVVPPLIWSHIEVPAPPADEVVIAPLRTDQFASIARDLALAPLAPAAPATPAPPAPIEVASPAPRLVQPETDPVLVAPPATDVALPAIGPEPVAAAPVTAPEPARATTTIEVAEHELASLVLPRIVSGVGPATRGSAVVIDGLPADARLTHGIRIAQDSWAIGMRDVAGAVLTLPRSTPGHIDLVVRVVAADSHELAANTLRIKIVRSNTLNAPVRTATRPVTHFEPAAALGEPGLDAIVPLPKRKPAMARDAPTPPVWQTDPAAGIAPRIDRAPRIERASPWTPFGDGSAP